MRRKGIETKRSKIDCRSSVGGRGRGEREETGPDGGATLVCRELTGHRLTVPAVSVSRRFDSGAICHPPRSLALLRTRCVHAWACASHREKDSCRLIADPTDRCRSIDRLHDATRQSRGFSDACTCECFFASYRREFFEKVERFERTDSKKTDGGSEGEDVLQSVKEGRAWDV